MVHPAAATVVKTEDEDRIVSEFCHLLEKSKQLFNGLRDLPPYGHKQWQTYFSRAFDIYTRLWKFQQQHRLVLDKKYKLKRWQIGEIASKIGQLYYHFYLRTSETNYLNEAFQFYGAIRARGYYSKKEERSDLIVKKLRYFARFIVVCLLLKRMKVVYELVRELGTHIDDYTATYEPEDQLEWSLVLGEIRAFIDADNPLKVIGTDGGYALLTHRLSPETTPLVEKIPSMRLELQEILIIGSKVDQIKFSELTIDMYRILQTLERDPVEDTSPIPILKRDNPHKQLLFKPSVETCFVYLSSGWKDLEYGGVLLLYISGDPISSLEKLEVPGYESGGVSTCKAIEEYNKKSSLLNEAHCIYPGDLITYSRKPMFLIVDSDNSYIYEEMSNPFGQPLVVLMSPSELPVYLSDSNRGSLFTLFLHSPLSAFCLIYQVQEVSSENWDAGIVLVERFMNEASGLLVRAQNTEDPYIQFFGDDFLRLLILRFLFCGVTLRMHRSFQSKSNYPRSVPQLNLDTGSLNQIIIDLSENFNVSDRFICN